MKKLLKETRPKTATKTRLMVELEQENDRSIEDMISAPLTCIKQRYGAPDCKCVRCLYSIPESTAKGWRKQLHISFPVGNKKGRSYMKRKGITYGQV